MHYHEETESVVPGVRRHDREYAAGEICKSSDTVNSE